MPSALRPWLQLTRAPNLFTVPGDPLVGFMLSNFGVPTVEAFVPIIASLCLYAAGLIDNDLADLAEDRAERPNRPMPSGAVRPASARIVALLLGMIGLVLCWLGGSLLVGCALVGAILLYNHGLKRIAVVGALTMGICRGLSVLLGASAAPARIISTEAIVAACVVVCFVAAVTNLARFETKSASPGAAKWLPAVVLLAGYGVMRWWPPMGIGQGLVAGALVFRLLLLLALAMSVMIALDLRKPDAPLPPTIGRLIRLLLVLQAALCAHTGSLGLMCAGLLLAAWPLSRAVSKRFYAS